MSTRWQNVEESYGFEAKLKAEFGMTSSELHDCLNEYEMINGNSVWTERFVKRIKEKQNEINNLCDDEGCPQHGIKHECINKVKTMDKVKVKMTRAEAIACLEKHSPHNYNTSHMIDFYIEAGMLEVVEEPEKPIFEIINEYDRHHIKIYANGKVDGFKGTIINRIPLNTKPI